MKTFQEFITEKVDDYNLYHFTDMSSIQSIIIDGCIYPSYDRMTGDGISMTRNKDLVWGDVRLTLDKRELQNHYKIKPVHWFDQRHKYQKGSDDYRQYGHDVRPETEQEIPANQNEERVVTKRPIPITYIKEIQVIDVNGYNKVKEWLDDIDIKLSIKGGFDNWMFTTSDRMTEGQVRFSKKMYQGKIPDDILDKLINTDPTLVMTYTKWIVESYLKSDDKDVFLEDLYKITEYLQTYEKMKKRNLIDKDIYKFKDYKALYQKIKEVGGFGEPTDSDNYLIEDRYFISNKEAEIFYEDEDYLIVIPRTYEASKFYANKTEWCTKFPDNYKSYSSKGNLYIIIDKDKLYTKDSNRLLQFHFETASFNDMDDHSVNSNVKKKFLSIFDSVKEKYQLRYDYVSKFEYERATVGIKTLIYKKYDNDILNEFSWKFGLIDRDGKELTKIKYDNMYFYHTMLLVKIGSKKGIIDIDCKEIIPIKYEYIDYNNMGYFIVKIKYDNKTTGLLDKKGKVLIPCMYNHIQQGYFYNRKTGGYSFYYTVSLEEKSGVLYGILDDNGKEILPVKYYNVLVTTGKHEFDDDVDKVYRDEVVYVGYKNIKMKV